MESIKEYDLCDIWRLRNLEVKRYTWRGVGQGKNSKKVRLDFFFVSNELQPFVKMCDIIPAPSMDHSAITIEFKSFQEDKRGPSFWKFNNSLLENEDYTSALAEKMALYKNELNENLIINPQLRWELLKHEIRKYTISFSKQLARNQRSHYADIENEITQIEKQKHWQENTELINKHERLLKELELLNNHITEGIIIRSIELNGTNKAKRTINTS